MSTSSPSSAADTATVRELAGALRSLAPATDDAERIERVRLFEEIKAMAAAAQAVEARAFDSSQRAQHAVAGQPAVRQGRGVAGQVALARRISPWAARRWLGWARILPEELPLTFDLLRSGRISEWRATLVARETIWLSREDRGVVDAELAPRLECWGDRRVEAEAKRAAYRLDPRGSVERSNAAAADRRVTLRPAPETMTRLSALLPVAQGVAAYAALCRVADTTTAGGDDRGRGQIMADTLVERVTGQASADAVPVEIELLVDQETLFGRPGDPGYDEPAELLGHGPVPAPLARDLALGPAVAGPRDREVGVPDDGARRRIRRLFTRPDCGQLITMESTARSFTTAQRRFLRYRDQDRCRTPWCEARIRHADHVKPAADGGPTDLDNGQGLCQDCNHARQAAGWRATTQPGGAIDVVTPTGHRYRSEPPAPPGQPPPRLNRSGQRVA